MHYPLLKWLTSLSALLFCTWGENGAVALQKRGTLEEQTFYEGSWAPSMESEVVDTVGAGDTFIAGMLFALTSHSDDWSLERKLKFSNEVAGRKVYQNGFAGLGAQMRPALETK